jgi:NAD(P)H dehydrogenase (quinone)
MCSSMQVLVTYYSRTGTTKKLAEHVARSVRQVPGVDCVLKPCAEVTREHFLKGATFTIAPFIWMP